MGHQRWAMLAGCALLCAGQAQAQEVSNPLHLSVHHITLGVASIETERKFYHDILGFRIGAARKRPAYDIQQMEIPGFRIDMIEQKGSTRPAQIMGNDKQGYLHLALEVPKAQSVYQQLQAKGVTVTPGRMDGGQIGSIYVTDPEGNRLELAQPN